MAYMKEWVLGNIIPMKDYAEEGRNCFQEVANVNILIQKFKRCYTKSCTFVISFVIHICYSYFQSLFVEVIFWSHGLYDNCSTKGKGNQFLSYWRVSSSYLHCA